MNTKWVATQNAGIIVVVSQSMKNWGLLLSICALSLVISCTKSDDLETIANDLPFEDELPIEDDPPNNSESIIVYTDIEPDYVSANFNDFYNLDLNNDLVIDYTLKSLKDSNDEWFEIRSNNNVNACVSVTPWYSHPVPLNIDTVIFNPSGFLNGESYVSWGFFIVGDCFGGEGGCSADWKDKTDRFLGLKFIIDGKLHYGWAQLDVISTSKWAIKDYAYNATPNKPINAGQKE
ncbi:hypothetical protein NA63_2260 [Flavobacteriaceae bacterium MAR_2010_105]|nr:hypothetical protein NA63_2260 [Flavobacteriaceae bacterium MAR_2010_105]